MSQSCGLFHIRPETTAANGKCVGQNEKLIGVYSAEQSAREAIDRLKSKPGFCDWPHSFLTIAYALDREHWVDGFVTVSASPRK